MRLLHLGCGGFDDTNNIVVRPHRKTVEKFTEASAWDELRPDEFSDYRVTVRQDSVPPGVKLLVFSLERFVFARPKHGIMGKQIATLAVLDSYRVSLGAHISIPGMGA